MDNLEQGYEKKKMKSWSKTVERDGITKKVSVREVENGFIICKSIWGTDSKGKYIDKSKEYISSENPLESEDKVTLKSGIVDSIKSYMSDQLID